MKTQSAYRAATTTMPTTTHHSRFSARKSLLLIPPAAAFRSGLIRNRKPAPLPVPPERWVIFEQGPVAHLMQDDDFFPAERTRCGRLPVDADLHPLPRFSSRLPDYLFCLRCLPPGRTSFQLPLPITS